MNTYYKDSNNIIHCLTADDLLTDMGKQLAANPNWQVITEAQADAIINPPLTLSQAQSAQALIIQEACAAAITGGISSSALGVAHTYPSAQTDQLNLTAVVVKSTLPGFTSAMFKTLDAGWLSHTATQIQQVGSDVEAFISTQLQHSANLQASIAAATTVPAVQSITW